MITFERQTASNAPNPFVDAPKSLVDLHFRLAFPYGVDVNIDGFCRDLVEGFDAASGAAAADDAGLQSLSFHSYDSALEKIYENLFARVVVGKGGVVTKALRSVNWHVKDAASWNKLKVASTKLLGLKELVLTVRAPKQGTVRSQLFCVRPRACIRGCVHWSVG